MPSLPAMTGRPANLAIAMDAGVRSAVMARAGDRVGAVAAAAVRIAAHAMIAPAGRAAKATAVPNARVRPVTVVRVGMTAGMTEANGANRRFRCRT